MSVLLKGQAEGAGLASEKLTETTGWLCAFGGSTEGLSRTVKAPLPSQTVQNSQLSGSWFISLYWSDPIASLILFRGLICLRWKRSFVTPFGGIAKYPLPSIVAWWAVIFQLIWSTSLPQKASTGRFHTWRQDIPPPPRFLATLLADRCIVTFFVCGRQPTFSETWNGFSVSRKTYRGENMWWMVD